jgi:NDP-sugar pyrophosphorylase family protein
MKVTLLVLAAGMGSRYGGLKQLDPMGPKGETILDYSIKHAVEAGFEKVVFVIRKDFAEVFKASVGDQHRAIIEVAYAFQKIEDLPDGYAPPENRTKPWGTAHAIRAARNLIHDPFTVINADDYYGPEAYKSIAEFFKSQTISDALEVAMVGYPVLNTLSPHGTVNRGICKTKGSYLETVEEHTEIHQTEAGIILGKNLAGECVELHPGTLASMNFWAFMPTFFQALEVEFIEFLKKSGHAANSECYLPTAVDSLIQSGKATCRVYPTDGEWFGVTYPEDKPYVQQKLKQL